ncbi:hypothetical protein HU200_027496 [Digitaria exilis]|uniref:Aldose 1-epimerase n=1 Tax=Digitaria exilis TaxID=1010633 RepID=A0A835BW75_9POAL|nr:hypothetical protein HU200_027496 [Digitaria exilis]
MIKTVARSLALELAAPASARRAHHASSRRQARLSIHPSHQQARMPDDLSGGNGELSLSARAGAVSSIVTTLIQFLFAIGNWLPVARSQLLLALLLFASGTGGRKMVGVYEQDGGFLRQGHKLWRQTNVPRPPRLQRYNRFICSSPQRISRGRFVLNGKVYHLYRNDGRNTLHGMERLHLGTTLWRPLPDSPYITLYYRSFDGEQGSFPGNLDAYVTYRLSSPYTLSVHMNATALDKATPVNLLLHTYWNLAGHGSGDVLGHTLRLFASRYAVLDDELLPSSGRLAPVAGTPFDFRSPTAIGARIRDVIIMGGKVVGYDANYIIDGDQGTMRPVCQVRDGVSGRAVELWANQATMQLYMGNWLNHTKGKDGKVYNQYAGFTMETMGYVDAVNHPEFPSQTLLPGQEYKHDMPNFPSFGLTHLHLKLSDPHNDFERKCCWPPMARGGELFVAALCVVVASTLAASAGARKTVGVYELRKGDFSVKVTNWGATIMSVVLPDSRAVALFPRSWRKGHRRRVRGKITLTLHPEVLDPRFPRARLSPSFLQKRAHIDSRQITGTSSRARDDTTASEQRCGIQAWSVCRLAGTARQGRVLARHRARDTNGKSNHKTKGALLLPLSFFIFLLKKYRGLRGSSIDPPLRVTGRTCQPAVTVQRRAGRSCSSIEQARWWYAYAGVHACDASVGQLEVYLRWIDLLALRAPCVNVLIRRPPGSSSSSAASAPFKLLPVGFSYPELQAATGFGCPNDTSFFGPVAARGRFVLDGKVYHLNINDGRNTLQGRGFHKVIWTVKEHVGAGDYPHITLYYRSFDGEQGFPGNLDVYVTYCLSSPYTLGVHMNATALDKATPVNLLQHTYWNLAGHDSSSDVLGHTLRLSASRYTPLDAEMLPSSGRVAPVAGTPYDFREPTPIGARIRDVMGGRVVGYDANYVVDGEPGEMRPVAEVRDGVSGRALELWGNQPCMQLYTGNWLSHAPGKGGKVYEKYAGFCLETQGYPDAVNHPEFLSQIIRPGQVYKHDMIFKLSTQSFVPRSHFFGEACTAPLGFASAMCTAMVRANQQRSMSQQLQEAHKQESGESEETAVASGGVRASWMLCHTSFIAFLTL